MDVVSLAICSKILSRANLDLPDVENTRPLFFIRIEQAEPSLETSQKSEKNISEIDFFTNNHFIDGRFVVGADEIRWQGHVSWSAGRSRLRYNPHVDF